jgi:hypothetical protein
VKKRLGGEVGEDFQIHLVYQIINQMLLRRIKTIKEKIYLMPVYGTTQDVVFLMSLL